MFEGMKPDSGPGDPDNQQEEAAARLKAEMEAANATEKGGIVGPVDFQKPAETLPEDIEKVIHKHEVAGKYKEDNEAAKILNEHGGLESNIPLNHPKYWKIR